MHAFSGNDCVSSFFGKGKQRILTLVLESEKFLQTFSGFGLFSYARDEFKIAHGVYMSSVRRQKDHKSE